MDLVVFFGLDLDFVCLDGRAWDELGARFYWRLLDSSAFSNSA